MGSPRTSVRRWHVRPCPLQLVCCCAVVVLLLASGNASFVFAQPAGDDLPFLAGLCQRRLFELAEAHCRTRLAGAVTPRQEAELTAEWCRIVALHASYAPPVQRQSLFAKAHRQASDFLRDRPNHPHLAAVRLQDALAWLAEGEFGRQQFETGALPPTALDPVRQTLIRAAKGCEQLERDLALEIPQRRRVPPSGDAPSADELFSWQMHAAHQAARASRNLALLYARGSPDRLALLQQAQEQLQIPLAQVSTEDPLAVSVRLDLAIGERLRERYASADELLAALDQSPLPPQVRLVARAERIRCVIDRQELTALDPLLALGRVTEGQTSAELDFAWFEAHLARAKSAAGQGGEVWRKTASDAARFLHETHGVYWGRRADERLLAAAPAGGAPDAQLLLRTADNLYAKGEAAQAIAAYDRAASLAASADPETAFIARYKAALAEQKLGALAAASQRFRTAATATPNHAQAPAAHLLAVWLAAETLKQGGDAAAYRALLREHLELWPSAASADQVRLWQGRLSEAERDWQAAFTAYRAVTSASADYAAAIAGAARALREQLEVTRARGESLSADLTAAGEWLRPLTAPPAPGAAWPLAAREALLGWADLALRFAPEQAASLEPLVAQAQGDDAPADWSARAAALRLLLLAAQPGKEREALALLEQSPGAPPAVLLEQLHGLRRLRERASPTLAGSLVRLELAALEQLQRQRAALPPADQEALDPLHAAALAAAGRRQEALARYAALVKQHPDNGPLREAWAGLLLYEAERTQVQQGLDEWRRIAARSKPNSPRWFSAKYHIALGQYRLGDSAAAAQLLAYLLETTPTGENPLAEQYRQLLAACRK